MESSEGQFSDALKEWNHLLSEYPAGCWSRKEATLTAPKEMSGMCAESACIRREDRVEATEH